MEIKNSGTVFNIQKFSVNDGPGIRTVVFLKGCPLHCKWCANPESQLSKIQVVWDTKKCIGCHHCVQICPKQVISVVGNNIHIDYRQCDDCNLCIEQCPQKALKTEGEVRTVEEIMKVVMQDEPFYLESDGGITLSGGELLMQPDFAKGIIESAKQHGLHVAIETTGFAKEEVFQWVIEKVDLLLFDMKHYNRFKHFEKTGVYNDQILHNLKTAKEMNKEILIRMPIIPDYNNSLQDAQGFCDLLKELKITKCQLLPFHQFGENKYNMLDKEYEYQDVAAIHREDLEQFKQVFIDNGIDAFF